MANAAPVASSTANTRPKVTLLSLEKQPWLDEMYSGLFTALREEANLSEITDSSQVFTALSGDSKPDIILATDAALIEPEFSTQLRDLALYVGQGGTLVFMGHFPSFARPLEFPRLFGHFGKRWEAGDYHRTTLNVNPVFRAFPTQSLVPYSQKALHVKNVAREDCIYLPSTNSRIQSAVFAPDQVGDMSQTPAALSKSGRGRIGYLGDVNAEEESTAVVLAMCGIST